jgi:hypothetical protein
MFEPKTYHEKTAHIYQLLLKDLITALPESVLQEIAPTYQQVMRSEFALRLAHAEEILGPVLIPAEERAQTLWVRRLLSANLGRTFFKNQLQGATHDGALGTKSYGMRWKDWLAQLPDLYTDLRAGALSTSFYADNSVVQVKGDQPIPYFIMRTENQIVMFAPSGTNLAAHQLYLSHLSEKFNWQVAEDELFVYRADLTRGAVAVALANALIAQGVNTLVVPFEGQTVVQRALADAGIDLIMTVILEDESNPSNNVVNAQDQTTDDDDSDSDDEQAAKEDLAVTASNDDAVEPPSADDAAWEELTTAVPGETVRFETGGKVETYSPNDLILIYKDGVAHNVTARAAVSIWAAAPIDSDISLTLETGVYARITKAELIVPDEHQGAIPETTAPTETNDVEETKV